MQKVNRPGEAAQALQLYLLADPHAASAQDVQMEIYKLQYEEKRQVGSFPPGCPVPRESDDLGKIHELRQGSDLLSIVSDLQEGGEKARAGWLAVCGQEIPDVVGKIIDITPGTDSVDIKVFTAATGEAIMAGTTANLDVTVAGQPEAATLEKGNQIKFTGKLVGYDAEPFMLHFDKAKVDSSAIPQRKQ